jgi:hypothetical protein
MHFDFLEPLSAGAGTMGNFRSDAELVGTVNEQALMGGLWQKGELLYMGGDYPDGRYVATRATHHFAAAPNLVDQVVSGVEHVTKEGWDVAWVEYQRITNAGIRAGQPVRVQIEKVYKYSSEFNSRLGFPY